MDAIVEKFSNRLEYLIGDINFTWDDHAIDSSDRFMAICKHNARQYQKFETTGEERQERIWDLYSNILAVVIQKLAMEKYGNTDEESIRKVLYTVYKETGSHEYWDRIMGVVKQHFLGFGLTEKQYQPIQEYLDTLPTAFIEVLADMIKPWRLLPAAETQSIALALTDLIEEVGYDYRRGSS
jgi:hypothetical protein